MSQVEKYSRFQVLIQRLAASTPGSWLLARLLHHLDPKVFRWSDGKQTLTSLLSGAPVLLVTTTGARSGRPRTLPLVPIRLEAQPDAFGLVASNWGQARHPAWYYNLKAHPQVTCAIAGRRLSCLAREAQGEEYAQYWACALETYPGFAQYQRRAAGRHIPIMILTPIETD